MPKGMTKPALEKTQSEQFRDDMLQMVLERQAQRAAQKDEEESRAAEAEEFKRKSEQLLAEASSTVNRYDTMKNSLSKNIDEAAMRVMVGMINDGEWTHAQAHKYLQQKGKKEQERVNNLCVIAEESRVAAASLLSKQ